MKSIGEELVICLSCKWTGIVYECRFDCDGEGSLGCLMCNKPVEQISNIVDELLELREGCELEEVSENEADTINIYEQEVHITNNYTTNYVDMESIEKLIDKKLNESFKPMKACCNE